MDKLVAVSFEPVEGAREAILAQTQGLAAVAFLKDLSPEARAAAVERADVLFASHFYAGEIPESEWSRFRKLRFVQTVYTGVERAPFSLIPEGAVLACNAGVFAEPLSEQVMLLALACAKRFLPKYGLMKGGTFDRSPTNRLLAGGTCGIVGFGGIGKAVAKRMSALGMKIRAVNRSGRTGEPVEWAGTLDRLDEMLPECDVVVLCLPLTASSRGLVDGRRLALMKEDATLVNVGRGSLVVEEDLYRHLVAHPVFHYGADVWWDEPDADHGFTPRFPFLDLPNVAATPHNGDRIPGIDLEVTTVAARNIRRFLEGEPPANVVNASDYTG